MFEVKTNCYKSLPYDLVYTIFKNCLISRNFSFSSLISSYNKSIKISRYALPCFYFENFDF